MSSSAIELPKGSLAELTDHLQALWDSIEGLEDGELKTEALAEARRYVDAEIRKVDNISDYIAKCEREADWLRNEIRRLRQQIDKWENRGATLREYVKRVMEQANTQRLEGRSSSFFLRAATPSVVITDKSLLPDEFVRKTIVIEEKKREIREAIEAGQDVPGADLALGGQTLVVRR